MADNGAYLPEAIDGATILDPVLWSSLCNSFEDRSPVDEIYGCPIFKWVAVTWPKYRV